MVFKVKMMDFWVSAIYRFLAIIFIPLKFMAPVRTGRITDTVSAIKTGAVNFYVYQKGGSCIALDSGVGGTSSKRSLGNLNIDADTVSAVFLSHSDFDHAGGVPLFPNAVIYISHEEEQLFTYFK